MPATPRSVKQNLATAEAMQHLGQYLAFHRHEHEGVDLLNRAWQVRASLVDHPDPELLLWQSFSAYISVELVDVDIAWGSLKGMGRSATALDASHFTRGSGVIAGALWIGQPMESAAEVKAALMSWTNAERETVVELIARVATRTLSFRREYEQEKRCRNLAEIAITHARIAKSADDNLVSSVLINRRALSRVEHATAAREVIAQTRAIMANPTALNDAGLPWAQDQYVVALLAEAERLIEGQEP